MNVSLVHHWMVSMRGGEKVLEQFCRLFPDSTITTLVAKKEKMSSVIKSHSIRESSLRIFPFSRRLYPLFLPAYPFFLKGRSVKGDIVISSDASIVKGFRIANETPHICYCHTPPRYLWDLQADYLERVSKIKGTILKMGSPFLRNFDYEASKRVDHFIANSNCVKERIKRIYNRDSEVIHPPVEVDEFDHRRLSKDFYLMVSALVPYKKVDLAIKAFNKNGKRLIIIGDGSEMDYLKSIAGPNIKLMGGQPFTVLKEHYETCKAFIFPGEEDFGITPLEAQAAGRPVIAYGKGGALDTVINGKTGIYFFEQTISALNNAIETFEANMENFHSENCRKNAVQFRPERFRQEIKTFLIERYPDYFNDFPWGSDN